MPSPETIGKETSVTTEASLGTIGNAHQPAETTERSLGTIGNQLAENPAATETEAALVAYCQTHADHSAARAVLNARNKEAARFALPIPVKTYFMWLVIVGMYRGMEKVFLNFAPYCGFWGIPADRGTWGACQFGVTDPQWWDYRRFFQDGQYHIMFWTCLGVKDMSCFGVSITFLKYVILIYVPVTALLFAFIRFGLPTNWYAELWAPLFVFFWINVVAHAKGTTPRQGWIFYLVYSVVIACLILMGIQASKIALVLPSFLQASTLQIFRFATIKVSGLVWDAFFCCTPNFHPYVFQCSTRTMFVGVPDCIALFAYFACSNRGGEVLPIFLLNFIIVQFGEMNMRQIVLKSFFWKIWPQKLWYGRSAIPGWEKPCMASRISCRVLGSYSSFLVFIPIGGFLLARGFRYDWQEVAWQIPKYPKSVWEVINPAIPYENLKELRFDTWEVYVSIFAFILQAFSADYICTWIQRRMARNSLGTEKFMETHARMQIPGEQLPLFQIENPIVPQVQSSVLPDEVVFYIWGDRIPVTWVFVSVIWECFINLTFFTAVAMGFGLVFI